MIAAIMQSDVYMTLTYDSQIQKLDLNLAV
jgi:hypothetical protein